jgi:hypothetical protein
MLYKGEFRHAYSAHATSAGALVSGEAGVSYIVTDIITQAANVISTSGAGGGDIIMRMGAGACNLTTPIKVAEGSGIYQSSTTPTTVVYHKD